MTDRQNQELTRDNAIDQLIARRIEEWDHPDDTDTALRRGRIGFETMSNAVLAELWENYFGSTCRITGEEPPQTIQFTPNDYHEILSAFSNILHALGTTLSPSNQAKHTDTARLQQHEQGTAILKKLQQRI